jgi:TRAP-type C4-dicarboxylate transport system substrate-binding protein
VTIGAQLDWIKPGVCAWRLRLLLALCAGAFLSACSHEGAVQGPQSITLTYASLYPPNHPFSRADQEWIAFIERESHGNVRIRPFWSGSLTSSSQNLTELRHGVADIGMITPMYSRSAHLQRVQASFYSGVDTIDDQAVLYRCLSSQFPELNDELPGLHVLAVQGGNFPGILTRDRPVSRLADLRGLRIRAQADMAGILRDLGADPVDMPMAEVYSAMARGVIDGVVSPQDALQSMHLAEVGHYFTTLHIPRGAYPGRAMAESRWQTLPPDVRALLTRGQDVWEAAMARQIHQGLRAGIDFAASHGVTFVAVTPAEQARFSQLYDGHVLEAARALNAHGIDAEPIVRVAWNLVATQKRGLPLSCSRIERS